jgi:hypothetical protein
MAIMTHHSLTAGPGPSWYYKLRRIILPNSRLEDRCNCSNRLVRRRGQHDGGSFRVSFKRRQHLTVLTVLAASMFLLYRTSHLMSTLHNKDQGRDEIDTQRYSIKREVKESQTKVKSWWMLKQRRVWCSIQPPLVPVTATPGITGMSEDKRRVLEQNWNLTSIPPNVWFTYKEDILKTKSPRHFYRNVVHTIDAYSSAFLKESEGSETQDLTSRRALGKTKGNLTTSILGQNSTSTTFSRSNDTTKQHPQQSITVQKKTDIHVTCMDNVYCARLINFTFPDLLPHFLQEPNGAFKGDICRLAALYLHGGYYFDVDMEVIEPYIAGSSPFPSPTSLIPLIELSSAKPRQENTNDVFFVTVWNEPRNAMFQSFMASTPGHPILSTAMDELLEYYKGKRPHLKGTSLLGPITLLEAYRQLTGGLDSFDNDDFVEFPSMSQSPNLDLQDDTQRTSSDQTIMASRTVGLTQDEQLVLDTSHMLQEAYLRPELYGSLSRRDTGPEGNGNCNFVVHDASEDIPYFYSRIVGSSNCPRPTQWERIKPHLPFVTLGTCGGGNVGNGRCYRHPKECCSKFGHCGTTTDYCSESRRARTTVPESFVKQIRSKTQKWVSKTFDWPTCGEGNRGNGKCQDSNDCCSRFGWCGTSKDHCLIY